MGRLKKDTKTKNKDISISQKKKNPEKTQSGNSLHLVEVSEEELKRLLTC